MRRAFANKVDNTEKALVAYAKSLGFGYAKVGLDWDGDLFWGQRVIPVDWKSPAKTATMNQLRLIGAGFPLRFIHRPEQVDALKAEMLKG